MRNLSAALIFGFMLTAAFTIPACRQDAVNESPKEEPRTIQPLRTPETEEAAVTYVADWDKEPNGKKWTKVVLKALADHGQKLVLVENPSDAKEFCPKFPKLTYEQRKQFFLMLISSMARYESSFKTENKYTEDFRGRDGEHVISRGLLQLSLSSANAYGCELPEAKSLHNAELNLQCGVRILNKWIPADIAIGSTIMVKGDNKHLGGARYWSVLRKSSEKRAKIRQKVSTLAFCK